MSKLNFIKNLAIVRMDSAVQSALDAIVRWDPKGASAADLRSMEDRLDGIGRKAAELQVKYDKEAAEAEAARKEYNDRVAAMQILRAKIEEATDPTVKEARTASFMEFSAKTKPFQEKATLEIEDEVNAKRLLDQVQSAYTTAAGKLKTAKASLERAQRDLESAEQRRQEAEQRAHDAREMAGLTNASNGIDIALKALKDATDKSNAEAGVLDRKAELLTPANPETEDAFVAEALREVQGTNPKPTLDEQMAAFKPL